LRVEIHTHGTSGKPHAIWVYRTTTTTSTTECTGTSALTFF
jgi:hypothetical protein